MKKIISLVLIVVLFSISGCSSDEPIQPTCNYTAFINQQNILIQQKDEATQKNTQLTNNLNECKTNNIKLKQQLKIGDFTGG